MKDNQSLEFSRKRRLVDIDGETWDLYGDAFGRELRWAAALADADKLKNKSNKWKQQEEGARGAQERKDAP